MAILTTGKKTSSKSTPYTTREQWFSSAYCSKTCSKFFPIPALQTALLSQRVKNASIYHVSNREMQRIFTAYLPGLFTARLTGRYRVLTGNIVAPIAAVIAAVIAGCITAPFKTFCRAICSHYFSLCLPRQQENASDFTAYQHKFTASQNRFTASQNKFTASQDVFTASHNRFTAYQDVFTVSPSIFTAQYKTL